MRRNTKHDEFDVEHTGVEAGAAVASDSGLGPDSWQALSAQDSSELVVTDDWEMPPAWFVGTEPAQTVLTAAEPTGSGTSVPREPSGPGRADEWEQSR
jgi:hypothetical protein